MIEKDVNALSRDVFIFSSWSEANEDHRFMVFDPVKRELLKGSIMIPVECFFEVRTEVYSRGNPIGRIVKPDFHELMSFRRTHTD